MKKMQFFGKFAESKGRRWAALTALVAAALMMSAPSFAAGSVASFFHEPSGFWSEPTIAGAGRIHYNKDLAFQPNPKGTYKVVFGITKMGAAPNKVSKSWSHVARAVNLYVAAGVPVSHLKFVAIAFGGGTATVIDNAHYKAKYGVDNPNLKIIKELKAKGVKVAVCRQAVAEHHFSRDWVSKDVQLAVSGLTTLIDFQLKGYALLYL